MMEEVPPGNTIPEVGTVITCRVDPVRSMRDAIPVELMNEPALTVMFPVIESVRDVIDPVGPIVMPPPSELMVTSPTVRFAWRTTVVGFPAAEERTEKLETRIPFPDRSSRSVVRIVEPEL